MTSLRGGSACLKPGAVVIAALALMIAVVPAGAQSLEPLAVTDAVRATEEDLAPARSWSSPTLAVSPDDAETVVGAAMENTARTCHLLRSNDAGQTWTVLDELPAPPEYPFCFNTSGMTTETPLAWGRDDTLYYGLAGWDASEAEGPRGNMSVLLSRSTDLGGSWETSVVRNARGKTGEEVETNSPVSSVVVDTSTGDQDIVHVAWRASYPKAPPTAEGFRAPRPPLVATSLDGGRTFSDPVNLNTAYGQTATDAEGNELPVEMGFGAPQAAVDNKGTLFVVFPATTPGTFPQTVAAPSQPLLLARSSDQGKTFSFTAATPPMAYSEGVQEMEWSPEGGEAGTLHIVYEDKPDQPAGGADRDIYHVSSTDGGQNFSAPVRLNDDRPEELRLQVTPNLSIAPDGRLDVSWWDFRNDPGTFVNDVYATSSDDNGATWSPNVRISDLSINRKLGVWSNGFDQREPPGMASSDALAVIAWDDTRLGDPVSQTQDIFSRTVQFDALPAASSNVLRYVAAGLGGLAVGGFLLLLVSVLARRLAERKMASA